MEQNSYSNELPSTVATIPNLGSSIISMDFHPSQPTVLLDLNAPPFPDPRLPSNASPPNHQPTPSTNSNSDDPDSSEDDEPGKPKKKQRTVWTVELHKKFVDVIAQIGLKKAVPTAIMEKMNVKGLSRESVASHLQKYRKYLNDKKITEENRAESPSSTGTLAHDAPPSGSIDGSFLPYSAAVQQPYQFMDTRQTVGNGAFYPDFFNVGAPPMMDNGAFHDGLFNNGAPAPPYTDNSAFHGDLFNNGAPHNMDGYAFQGGLFNNGTPTKMDNSTFHGGFFNNGGSRMGEPLWMTPPISMRPSIRMAPTRVGPVLEERREIGCKEIKELPLFPTGND